MGKDEVSAIPSQLTGWASWAYQQNGDLSAAARKLNTALEKLNQAGNSSYVLGQVAYVGNDVIGYSARNEVVDSWVGQVGNAFAEESHKGVPPQIYRQDPQSYLNSKVTTTNGAITGQVPGDPVDASQKSAQAVELAARLREAEDTNDLGAVKSIMDQLSQNQYDPAFCSAFFKELGPGYTKGLPIMLGNPNSPDFAPIMTVFDTALASATNSADWNPDFNSQLNPPPGTKGWYPPNWADLALIKYAQTPFSEDFLYKAADSDLFAPQDGQSSNYKADPQTAQVIFNALAQNPSAALHYMIDPPPDGQGWYFTNRTRQSALLLKYGPDMGQNSDEAAAFANLIAQAGTAPDARMPYVGPYGTEPRIQVLLHQFADMSDKLPSTMIPNNIRAGYAKALAENIDLFLPPEDPKHPGLPEVGSDWNWQEKLFKAVSADNDGNVNEGSVEMIQQAIQDYALAHLPDVNPDDPASVDAYRAFVYQMGTLWALAVLPMRQGGYDKDKFREKQIDGIKTILGLIPIPVPEGHKVLEYMVDHADEWGREVGAKWAASQGKNPDSESAEIYYRQLGDLRLMLAQKYVADHPSLVAGKDGKDTAEYIHQLAEGTDPSGGTDKNIANFESYLDSASIAFANQYQNPTRK